MDRMDMTRKEYFAETGVHLKWGITKQEYLARDAWFSEAMPDSLGEGLCTCYRSNIYYKFNREHFAGGVIRTIVTIGCDGCGISKRLTDGSKGRCSGL